MRPTVEVPRYAHSWPERPEESVNVLCEGPSILSVKPEDLLDGPVVAVNHALAISRMLPIDCWATVDAPKFLWSWAQPYLHPQAKLWTAENNLVAWGDLIGDEEINRRMYAWVPTYMDYLEPAEGDTKPPVLPTVIPVLAWLSHTGARHVRLFGCDMAGSNSPLSIAAYSDEEDEGWEYRWIIERQLICLATLEYRKRGKRLERWAPVPHGSRNLLSWWSKTRQLAKL